MPKYSVGTEVHDAVVEAETPEQAAIAYLRDYNGAAGEWTAGVNTDGKTFKHSITVDLLDEHGETVEDEFWTFWPNERLP